MLIQITKHIFVHRLTTFFFPQWCIVIQDCLFNHQHGNKQTNKNTKFNCRYLKIVILICIHWYHSYSHDYNVITKIHSVGNNVALQWSCGSDVKIDTENRACNAQGLILLPCNGPWTIILDIHTNIPWLPTRSTDNTMAIRKKTNKQTVIYKTLHRK
jgi:hypothetical protein